MANQEIENLRNLFANSRQQREDGVKSSVEEMRVLYNSLGQMFPVGADVKAEKISAGGVAAESISAKGSDDKQILLYFHGGGYAIGGFESHRTLVADLARASGRRGILIDYRLAPENSFPAPVEDAVTSYKWLLESGVGAKNIALAGDSAGGGLVIASLLKLRDEGFELPSRALCISPWADLEMKGESHQTRAEVDPMVFKDDLQNWADIYLKGQPANDPLASPVNADLTGLPPLLIHVGDAEVLLDDARTLAKNAKASGVEVTLREWQDMIHVWHQFAGMVSDGVTAIAEAGEFLKP